jgi:hypothetical protein
VRGLGANRIEAAARDGHEATGGLLSLTQLVPVPRFGNGSVRSDATELGGYRVVIPLV